MTEDNVRIFSPGGKPPEDINLVPEPDSLVVDGGYKMELLFNSEAQLTRVNYPSDFTVAMAANHLAVAMLFLAQQLVEASK